MDTAVLRAYGWGDIADRAAPEFIEQEADEGKKPKTRLDWPAEFKDEVLACPFRLNAGRATAERATGVPDAFPRKRMTTSTRRSTPDASRSRADQRCGRPRPARRHAPPRSDRPGPDDATSPASC